MSSTPSAAVRHLLVGVGLCCALLALYLTGFWVELLWYSAMDSSTRFWSFGPSRVVFAIAGALVFVSLSWSFLRLFRATRYRGIRRWSYLSIAAICGLLTGLGMWELSSMLAQNCSGAELIELISLCNKLRH